MTENTGEEGERFRSRWSTLSRRKRLVLVLSLVFSAATISLLIALSRKPCNTNEKEDCDKEVIVHVTSFLGVVFSTISLVSACVIIVSCLKKTRERNSREMAVSYIPDEDLDNSAARERNSRGMAVSYIPDEDSTPPYFPPFGDASSSQLPDYFTAVQNILEDSSQRNEEFWTEDIDGSDDENEKPPCYEQALTMSGLSASEDGLENQAA